MQYNTNIKWKCSFWNCPTANSGQKTKVAFCTCCSLPKFVPFCVAVDW